MPNHGAPAKSNPVRPLAALQSILRRCPVWMWSRASPVQDSPGGDPFKGASVSQLDGFYGRAEWRSLYMAETPYGDHW